MRQVVTGIDTSIWHLSLNWPINISLMEFLNEHKRFPVIAITWPAWAWKSTFVSFLKDNLKAKVFTEKPEESPFLWIIDETKWKVDESVHFANQNYFLATDVLELTKWFINSKSSPIIFDFWLQQPFVFSDMNLSWLNLKTFNDNFYLHKSILPKPDIIIEIQVNNETLVRRLTWRWDYIDDQLIKRAEELNWYYNYFWIVEEHYNWGLVIKVNNDKNLTSEEMQTMLNTLAEKIRQLT